MFAAVRFEYVDGAGFFSRLGDRLGGRQLRLELRSFCGAGYLLVTQRVYDGIRDWGEIAGCCEAARSGLVLPEGVEPPAEYGLRRFDTGEFHKTLVLLCAGNALRLSGGSGDRPVGLYDPDGGCAAGSRELAEAGACAVKVFTARADCYSGAAAELLYRAGVPLLLVDSPSELEDCVFCAAPFAGMFPALRAPPHLRLRVPVAAAPGVTASGRPTVAHLEPCVPDEFTAAAPEGVPLAELTAAAMLTAVGTVRPAVSIASGRIDGRSARPEEIYRTLSGGCGAAAGTR